MKKNKKWETIVKQAKKIPEDRRTLEYKYIITLAEFDIANCKPEDLVKLIKDFYALGYDETTLDFDGDWYVQSNLQFILREKIILPLFVKNIDAFRNNIELRDLVAGRLYVHEDASLDYYEIDENDFDNPDYEEDRLYKATLRELLFGSVEKGLEMINEY